MQVMTSIGRTVPPTLPAQSADGVVALQRGSKIRDESLPHRHGDARRGDDSTDSKLAAAKLREDAPRIVGPASNLKEAGANSKLPAAKLREDAPRVVAPASKLDEEAARGTPQVSEPSMGAARSTPPLLEPSEDAARTPAAASTPAGAKPPAAELSDRDILTALRALSGEQGTIVDKSV